MRLSKKAKILTILLLLLLIIILAGFYFCKERLLTIYEERECGEVKDRKGERVALLPNEDGYYSLYLEQVPGKVKELLVLREDKLFYYHPGFNPWSIFHRGASYVGLGRRQGSSTITQQLVKVLLKKEAERSLKNKLVETFYALALETYLSKEEILKMYANSVYFGNQAQGFAEASHLYFGLPPRFLSKGQIMQLLVSTSRPTERNPSLAVNEQLALSLGSRLGLEPAELETTDFKQVRHNMDKHVRQQTAYFEIKSFLDGKEAASTTCDLELTKKVREIISRNLEKLDSENVNNGAALVVKLPENEILAMVGSADPHSDREGHKINMLFEPRPIGSTIKPFIYLKGFEKGLRPYTLVSDREYKYVTGLGFPLYPKNFDYRYRGDVTLHYALSNSLNVPSVKVLEFVGLQDFYDFLREDLEMEPSQPLDAYQLGIALGALEIDLYHLSSSFTLFAREGIVGEAKLEKGSLPEKKVSEEKYIQLVNKILSDRKTGIEQFGMVSNLNLPQDNYALKTGTSRDFRDSWIVGYTPDFLVGVWAGNADNSPTEEVSGQKGAGLIWSEIMELLLASDYNQKTPFQFDEIKGFRVGQSLEYGLEGDNVDHKRNLLKEKDKDLVLFPHPEDIFILEKDTLLSLEAKEEVSWYVNGELVGRGRDQTYKPLKAGTLLIRAESDTSSQEFYVYLKEE